MKKSKWIRSAPWLLVLFLAACATLQAGYSVPGEHPMELEKGSPTCTECHEARTDEFVFERFNHTPYFSETHRQEAYQAENVCRMCHATSFCNDCHATRVELKPSIRHQTETYRRMPHRGDFLARHRIEGRIDPTSCFRCHGNPKTAQSCVRCHQ